LLVVAWLCGCEDFCKTSTVPVEQHQAKTTCCGILSTTIHYYTSYPIPGYY
jgi:hypothetical protein